jgi:hypothetical protein
MKLKSFVITILKEADTKVHFPEIIEKNGDNAS